MSPTVRKQLNENGGICYDFENGVEFRPELGIVKRHFDLTNSVEYQIASEVIFGHSKTSPTLEDVLKVVRPGDRVLFDYSDVNVALALVAALFATNGQVYCWLSSDIESELRQTGLGWLIELKSLKNLCETGTASSPGRKPKPKPQFYTLIVTGTKQKSSIFEQLSPFGGIVFDVVKNKITHERRGLK